MNKLKIINDPIHGFIRIPTELIFDLIEHPYFQRLRYISQGGFSSLVYPGAKHTRFHHALGAMHLMKEVTDILVEKGVDISPSEREALYIAILLHDVGHGPYSHALEGHIFAKTHEMVTLEIMKKLNIEFDGKLDLAIQIFEGKHPRSFFNELVSSQIDVDRLDYLTRDSFYTGVVEGTVGVQRLVQMMNVLEDQLVIEIKGLLSVEKFLLARKHMYLQVYQHRTTLSAEVMGKLFLESIKMDLESGKTPNTYFEEVLNLLIEKPDTDEALQKFLTIDDIEFLNCLKYYNRKQRQSQKIFIAKTLINRRLPKCEVFKTENERDLAYNNRINSVERHQYDLDLPKVFKGEFHLEVYDKNQEIKILNKFNEITLYSNLLNGLKNKLVDSNYYICYLI